MSLIVEDGTGLPNSESYISVAGASAYFLARDNVKSDAWGALDVPVQEGALRLATEYMQQAYRIRWASFRVTATQALDWPRAYVPLIDAPYGYGSFTAYVKNNVVPVEVQRACAELAYMVVTSGALAPNLDRTTVKEMVGPLSVEYDKGSVEFTRYRSIDLMLRPYLWGSAVSSGLVRT